MAGAKDHRLDSFVLADGVAGGGHLFCRVQLKPEPIIALREAGRMHDELRELIGMACPRLRQQLLRFFPQVLALGDCGKRWMGDRIELVETPHKAQGRSARIRASGSWRAIAFAATMPRHFSANYARRPCALLLGSRPARVFPSRR